MLHFPTLPFLLARYLARRARLVRGVVYTDAPAARVRRAAPVATGYPPGAIAHTALAGFAAPQRQHRGTHLTAVAAAAGGKRPA